MAPPPNRFLTIRKKKTVIFKTTELLAANRTLRDAAKRVATLAAQQLVKRKNKIETESRNISLADCVSVEVTLPRNAPTPSSTTLIADRSRFRFLLTGTLSSRLLSRSPPIDRPVEAFRDITVQRRSIPARLNRSNVGRTSVRRPQPMITHRSRPLFYLFHAATFFHIYTGEPPSPSLRHRGVLFFSFFFFSLSLLRFNLVLVFPLSFAPRSGRQTRENARVRSTFSLSYAEVRTMCVLTSELTNE